jgi:hypothetical protein
MMAKQTVLPLAALACVLAAIPSIADDLPLKSGSTRFAVIGDMGTGGKAQYQVGEVMEQYRQKTAFDFVLTLGDNIYGGHSPADLKRKFEDPYKSLLDAGVEVYAPLCHPHNPNQRFYKPFNMGEKRYYSFKKGNAEFFALDSSYMTPEQISWLDKALHDSGARWKICYFHHPLYDDARYHGADSDLRTRLEPIFIAGGVQVVLAGHEHVYERLQPHKGIYYFVLGNSGELRDHNLRPSADMAKGFDTDRGFMIMEIAGDQLYFQTISRLGQTVDSGVIERPNNKQEN